MAILYIFYSSKKIKVYQDFMQLLYFVLAYFKATSFVGNYNARTDVTPQLLTLDGNTRKSLWMMEYSAGLCELVATSL